MQAIDTSWKGSSVKGYFLAYSPVHFGASNVPAWRHPSFCIFLLKEHCMQSRKDHSTLHASLTFLACWPVAE